MDGDGGHARRACQLIRSNRRNRVTSAQDAQRSAQIHNEVTFMNTVGLIGIGKIGLPIADNLIKSGHRVVGYRRSSLAEFEKIGGVPARSAADVGAQADIVLTCLPSTEALDDVVAGPRGLVHS
ncbi:MAG: NAD(P)-binding domain-containing protein, partial [Xanthobacteraceae bacterium]